MIEVANLSKHFGSLKAVDRVSFTIEKGEIVGFLGPNGAGKTTTMRVLSGFFPPTDGTASIDGHDVFEDSLRARRKIGYLPERPPLYGDMSVRRYLKFVAEIKDVPRDAIDARVEAVMERVGLKEMAHRLIRNLSKGYRQRTGLAQAIVHDPPVLILDEPTSGLDPAQIIETREMIKELAGDHTVILSTHILSEVAATCERVIIIHRGRIAADQAGAAVGSSRTVRVTVRGPRDDVATALEAIDGVSSVEGVDAAADSHSAFLVQSNGDGDVREDIFKTIVAGNWVLLELRPEAASLEQIFMKVTG